MKMTDQGKLDDKIIAVHYDDQEYSHYHSIEELPVHRLKQIQRFFEDYKILENKSVTVEGFEGKKEALTIIAEAVNLYKQNAVELKK